MEKDYIPKHAKAVYDGRGSFEEASKAIDEFTKLMFSDDENKETEKDWKNEKDFSFNEAMEFGRCFAEGFERGVMSMIMMSNFQPKVQDDKNDDEN